MFSPDARGLGNILMQLCHVDTVSDKIYDGHRGTFLKFDGIHIKPYDPSIEPIIPPLYINPQIHSKISTIIKPSEYAMIYINKYKHLIDDVSFAFQIRRGHLSSNENISKNSSGTIFCTDETIEKFIHIMKHNPNKKVFISSDCLQTKLNFNKMFPNRVMYIDDEPEFIINTNNHEPWVSFTDFFLLGMCPLVYITGGFKDMLSFSTFGYMACMYGKNQCVPIFNDEHDTIIVSHNT
jgi:hypothetical protein